jgi:single-strand DNA-binding protein
MNRVLFLGRLTANPEYKINENEKKITRFRLAVDNGKNYDALFINVVTFDRLADQCYKYLQKASQIFIEGRLDCRQDSETKQNYYSVVAQRVTFLKGTKTIQENEEKQEEKTEEKGE